MTLDDRKRLLAQLHTDEGLRLKPYRDTVGKLTIGYGRNLDDRGITQHEAEALLVNDLRYAEAEIERAFSWFTGLGSVRQAVLLNMAFNLGVPRLLGFNRMIDALQRHAWDEAAVEMLDSKWSRQVGERSTRLAQQMRSGRWTS